MKPAATSSSSSSSSSSSDPLNFFDLLRDTTSEHDIHIFSDHCLICTKKQAAPSDKSAAQKKSTSSSGSGGNSISSKKRPLSSTGESAKYNGLSSSSSSSSSSGGKRTRKENNDGKGDDKGDSASADETASKVVGEGGEAAVVTNGYQENGDASAANANGPEPNEVEAAALAMNIRPLAPAVAMAPVGGVPTPANAAVNGDGNKKKPFWEGEVRMKGVAKFNCFAKILRGSPSPALREVMGGGGGR